MKSLTPLLFATFISDFGSSLTIAAIPVLFLNLGRPDGVGIYNLCFAVGATLGCFFGFGFIDKFRKNRVAATSDIIRGMLIVPLIIQTNPSVWLLVAYAITEGIFGSTTSSAIQSWIAEHQLSSTELKTANSKIEIASQIGNGLGPFAGVLIALHSGVSSVFLIDCITYFIGAILIYQLEAKKPERRPFNALEEISEGYRYVIKTPRIQKWVLVSLFHCIGFASINTVYVKILDGRIHASESMVFLFQSAYFIGALLGGAAILKWKSSVSTLFKQFSLLLTALLMCDIFAPNYFIFFLLASAQSFSRIITVIATRSIIGQLADENYIGRAMAFRLGAINVGSTLAYSIIVPLSPLLGINTTLLIGALFFLASILPVISEPKTT